MPTTRLSFPSIATKPGIKKFRCRAAFIALLAACNMAHADNASLIREGNAALTQKDYATAFSKFSVLAQQGNDTAQYNLGIFYQYGMGVPKNEETAFQWYGKAASQGNERALQLLQNASAQRNEYARNELRRLRHSTDITPPPNQPPGTTDDSALINDANAALIQKDYNTAFSKFSVLAQRGSATAQYNLGVFYLYGMGAPKNEEMAFQWHGKAASQGNERALQVLQNASAQGNKYAKKELGLLQQSTSTTRPPEQPTQPHAESTDESPHLREANEALTQKDYSTAYSKFSILAQQGNAAAQYNIGILYLNGLGVPKDEAKAFYWLEESAMQGHAPALFFLRDAAAQRKAPTAATHTPENQLKPGTDTAADAEPKNTTVTKDSIPQSSIPPHESSIDTADDASPKSKPTDSTAMSQPTAPDQQSNIVSAAEDTTKSKPATSASKSRSTTPRHDRTDSSEFALGAALGYTGELTGIQSTASFGVQAGYRFKSNLGVELAYSSLYRDANADDFLSATTPGSTGTFNLNALSLVLQYIYAVNDRLSLIPEVGFHQSRFTVESNGTTVMTGSSNGLVAGIKLEYALYENHLGLVTGFDTHFESGDITGTLYPIWIGINYKF